MHVGMDEHAAGGGAALTLAGETHAGDGAADGLVDVGILHDDHRALAAKLQGNRDQLVGGRLVDDLPGLDGAGEGDLADLRMGDQRGAAFRAVTGQHVETAGRQHGSQDLADAQHGQRCFLGGLHHHGVTCDQCRSDFQCHQQQRHVPRNDRTDNADRLAHSDGQHVRMVRNGFALQLGSEAGMEQEGVGQDRGFDPAFRAQGLAGFQRDQAAEFLDMVHQDLAAFMDQRAPVPGPHLAPFLLRRCGILDRKIDVGLVAFGAIADDGSGGRVNDLEAVAGGGRDQLAADQVTAGQGLRQRVRIGVRGEGRFAREIELVAHQIHSPSSLRMRSRS